MSATPAVVIVGAGPRGVGVLERLVANAPELLGPGGQLLVHLVDPHPPGGGRLWRDEQPALLRLNSMAEDVTLFLDDSVRCRGPIRPGPTMAGWAPLGADRLADPELAAEAARLGPMSFPSRRLGSAYLTFVLDEVIASLPSGAEVVVHPTTAIDLRGGEDGRHVVELADGSELDADAVVLTVGHLDVEPFGEHATLAAAAERAGLTYLPPAYGADVELSPLAPGMEVLVRGFGLAFVDLMALLTEGRGGRFEALGGGRLRYHPSGLEPRLHVGSGRGTPYHSKLAYRLQGTRPQLPRFFDADAVDRLLARPGPLDFRRDVWPLLAKEVAWAGYAELFSAHPGRTTMPWDRFDRAYAALDWGSDALGALVAEAVPGVDDRVDFAALDRPLDGVHVETSDELQDVVRAHVRADVDRRGDPTWSADLGLFDGFLSVFGQLPRVLASPAMSARSVVEGFDRWWWGFFNAYASGPPPFRLEELLALADAGLVRFLGAGLEVGVDEGARVFRARSTSCAQVVEAEALVEATNPVANLGATREPLVRHLADRGELSEAVLVDHDGTAFSTGAIRVDPRTGAVVDIAGHRSAAWFALGPHTTSKAPAFARPRSNAPAFRVNDACARAVLGHLARDVRADHVATTTGRG